VVHNQGGLGVKKGEIRTFALVGHSSAGKTTMGEAILFKAGVTSRPGSVEQGNTLLDFDPEEVKRKISINMACANFQWKGGNFYMIDTPGFMDFMGEVLAALKVVENAVVVVDATDGVALGTERYAEVAKENGIPRFFFINKMKSPEVSPSKLIEDLKEAFGASITPFQWPIGDGENFSGVFDLLSGDPSVLPDDVRDEVKSKMESLRESVIELSEELLNKYLEGEEIPQEKFEETLLRGIIEGELLPVLFGDATELIGIEELLDFIAKFGASPTSLSSVVGISGEEEKEIERNPDGPFVGYIFKTLTEAHLGELYHIKVFSGKLQAGVEVLNPVTGRTEKVNQIYLLNGKDRKEIKFLETGAIGALVKLKETKTGHTLSDKSVQVKIKPVEFPEPLTTLAIIPKTREDEEKVSEGLTRLSEEDPTFHFRYDPELKQTIISGLGEIHLEVIVSKLKEKFNVSVETTRPKIPYRETIRKPAEAMGKYVKQTGGRGQYGICYIKIEPLKRGEGYEFVNAIFGGAIPNQFIPSVETGIKKAMQSGVLAGYPVVDVKVTLYDGKYHPVDSSNIAFEIAGSMAMKEAESKANPYLLEPIYEVEVIVPEENMGDVIGDLNARRGRILGMESVGRMQKVRALVPLAELHRYSSTLRSITKGRGTFTMKFSHYDEVPADITQKIIEESKREKEKEEK
jgi:elongation factor G